MTAPALVVRNAERVDRTRVPRLPFEAFRAAAVEAARRGARLVALVGTPAHGDRLDLLAVLARDAAGQLDVFATDVGTAYPALTPDLPAAHLFERDIAEQWGVHPDGHPWLKPVRGTRPPADPLPGAEPATPPSPGAPAQGPFFRVVGDEIHEVAVGPVHAGVIEPGHFRFQCHGETVLHLEIALGYQHRGIERRLREQPDSARMPHYMETLAGDTTIGHATAWAHAVEALAGVEPSMAAQGLRGIALELERLANHTGDLGALAGDVGFLPTLNYCGRIRGDFLNLTALVCGNRFGRGLVRPGGVGWTLDAERARTLRERLAAARADVASAVNLLWTSPSVLARFEETGALTAETARAIGLVGPAARASGIDRDVRPDFPAGVYRFAHVPVATWDTGDVLGRATVRWLEIERSIAFIEEQLDWVADAKDAARMPVGPLAPEALVVSLVEGWRGEIAHVAWTDATGRLARYKVIDPSFHNWFGLALALRNQPISDFPLCNKSFNLSYCGFDL